MISYQISFNHFCQVGQTQLPTGSPILLLTRGSKFDDGFNLGTMNCLRQLWLTVPTRAILLMKNDKPMINNFGCCLTPWLKLKSQVSQHSQGIIVDWGIYDQDENLDTSLNSQDPNLNFWVDHTNFCGNGCWLVEYKLNIVVQLSNKENMTWVNLHIQLLALENNIEQNNFSNLTSLHQCFW